MELYKLLYLSAYPVALFIGTVLRPCLLSLGYGILLLLWPLCVSSVLRNANGPFLHHLLVCCVFSFAAVLAQLCFHVSVIVSPYVDEQLVACQGIEPILRVIGLQKLNDATPLDGIRLLLPDVLVFFTAAICLLMVRMASRRRTNGSMASLPMAGSGVDSELPPDGNGRPAEKCLNRSRNMSIIVPATLNLRACTPQLMLGLLFGASAIIYPCLWTVFYFLMFLLLMTLWSIYKEPSISVSRTIVVVLLIYAMVHLIALYLYQLWPLQMHLDSQSLSARLVGFKMYINASCENVTSLNINRDLTWYAYSYPVVIFAFYMTLAFQSFMITIPVRRLADLSRRSSTESLISLSPSAKDDRGPFLKQAIEEDEGSSRSNGSPTVHSRYASWNCCAWLYTAYIKLFPFLLHNFYTVSLVIMMTWAVLYHSWLSFVWLVVACVVWMCKDSRMAFYHLSPFVLFYAQALVALQFIYGLELTDAELPDEVVGVPMKQIGLVKPLEAPVIPLFVKLLFTISFWITLRLVFYEKTRGDSFTDSDRPGYGTFPRPSGRCNVLEKLLAKYWIYVVALVLLLISIRQPVFVYNIIYMAFFTFLVSSMMFFRPWKKMLFTYWLILAADSICVLLLIYTYQFHGVPELWRTWTSWSNETLTDFGLVAYSSGSLFLQLLTPISFLIVVILQLKFFHAGFLRIINPIHCQTASVSDKESSARRSRLQAVMKTWDSCADVTWKFLEIHINKIVAFVVFLVAIMELSAVNLLFPVLAVLMLTLRQMHSLLCFLVAIWAAAIVLAKMLFQLHFAKIATIPISAMNCSAEFAENASAPADSALWAGFSKTDSISAYLQSYIWLFILLAFQVIVHQRQLYSRTVKGKAIPPDGVLFENIGRKEADISIKHCAMYLANYGFYKFGLEIFYVTVIIDIAVRMDAVAFIYGMMLLALISLNRKVLANLWFIVVLFFIVAVVTQYAMCVGLPPTLCIPYPWHWDTRLIQWLYLPDYLRPPNVHFLLADFFVVLTATCQLYVFNTEKRYHGLGYAGGDNTPISQKEQQQIEDGEKEENQTPDFITYCDTGLDVLKVAVFKYFHWVTLMAVFAAGVGGVSAFAFGYLIAAFSFLWKGNDLYLKPFRVFVRRWHILLYYNVVAILLKVALQVVGCVYLRSACNTSPSLVQLFSIACIHSGLADPPDLGDDVISTNCKVSSHQAQILYDSICFAFLVFQLRIVNSWYFKHVIVEIKAEQIFSARGAVLIDQLVRRKMNKQQKHEDEVVEKVKHKTKRIRERYLKHLKEGEYFEPQNYADAKRAGDYYMFDDSESELEDSKVSEGDEEECREKDDAAVSPGQMLHMAMETELGLNAIAEVAEESNANDERPLQEMIEEKEAKEEEEEKEARRQSKLCACCKFLGAIVVAYLKRMTAFFNRWSSEHRYVACVLDDEKRRLKASLGKELYTHMDAERLQQLVNKSEIGQRIYRVPSECSLAKMQYKVESSWADRSVCRRFLNAVYYLLTSNTDIICYLMIIFNQMFNASVISLPLPFFAFLWGTLCTPRPPKVFWVTLITYLESMIVVKFVLQFGFFPWNQLVSSSDPFYPPRILGVEKKPDFATFDIALLMVLFFHRHHLKTLGLWRESTDTGICFDDIDRLKAERQSSSEQLIIVDDNTVKDTFELKELSRSDENHGASEPKTQSLSFRDGAIIYLSPIATFFRRVVSPPFRYIMDLYAWMFLCDFICFLISAFSYTSFGVDTGRGDVVADIQSNKVPLPYVIILMLLMLLMVIDRAIYLRKSVVGKLCFQYVLVIGTHVWIFFILPAITGRNATRNMAAMLWYFVKSVYLLVSAVQIRNGYPSRSLSNFLTKHYSFLNYCLFTAYRTVPFLFELRTLIDWIWIETSMPLFDYITMENIFARVYSTKCNREYEKEYPVPRGKPKTFAVKYGMGVPILLLLITLLWLPLLLFSTVNTIGIRLLPEHSNFKISVDGFPTLYSVEAQGPFIKALNPAEFDQFYRNYTSKHAVSFLREYSPSDTVRATYRKESDVVWAISAPGREAMLKEASSSADMTVTLEFDFQRPSQGSSDNSVLHSFRRQLTLSAGSPSRKALIGVLKGDATVVPIENAFPWLVVLPALGPVHPAYSLLDAYTGGNDTIFYADLYLHLHMDNATGLMQWWEVAMATPVRPSTIIEGRKGVYPEQGEKESVAPSSGDKSFGLQITAFVDRVFPSALSYFTSRGIIGVYLVVVLAAARLIRTLVVTSPLELIINEIPNVDKVLRLCLDIFLVREAKDFLLEIDLYAKLIFLLRSPETLIRYTRPKVE